MAFSFASLLLLNVTFLLSAGFHESFAEFRREPLHTVTRAFPPASYKPAPRPPREAFPPSRNGLQPAGTVLGQDRDVPGRKWFHNGQTRSQPGVYPLPTGFRSAPSVNPTSDSPNHQRRTLNTFTIPQTTNTMAPNSANSNPPLSRMRYFPGGGDRLYLPSNQRQLQQTPLNQPPGNTIDYRSMTEEQLGQFVEKYWRYFPQTHVYRMARSHVDYGGSPRLIPHFLSGEDVPEFLITKTDSYVKNIIDRLTGYLESFLGFFW